MKLLLADDHGLFRDSLALWLEKIESTVGVVLCNDLQSAEQALKNEKFNLIILDLYMPGMQGAKSIKTIVEQYPDTPLIVVSAEESPLIVQQCMKAGAKGYVPKSLPGDCILSAVRQVLNDGHYLPKELLMERGVATELDEMQLTDKQQRVLELLCRGQSNREIADNLFLSEGTVKQYVTKLLRLLEVDNRVQASIKGGKLLGN